MSFSLTNIPIKIPEGVLSNKTKTTSSEQSHQNPKGQQIHTHKIRQTSDIQRIIADADRIKNEKFATKEAGSSLRMTAKSPKRR